jgi:hypothetical protein
MNVVVFDKICSAIVEVEAEYSKSDHKSGYIKKGIVLSVINAFMDENQKKVFNPIIGDLIDLIVQLMNSDRMLGLTSKYCCF